MRKSAPILKQNAVQIAWDYLERRGNLFSGTPCFAAW
jgi:hypothetical protein